MRSAIIAILAALAAGSASAQPSTEQVPAACQGTDANGRPPWAACAAAAAPGSGPYVWANINLGTQAYLNNDFAEAVRRYDMAIPPGSQIYSDASFHAFRSGAYEHVGRTVEALADARLSARMLAGDPTLPEAVRRQPPPAFDHALAYQVIVPILKRGDAPEFAAALAAYKALPANDWMSLSNRAAAMDEVGDHAAAIKDSTAALAIESGHPGVLNNHCYILTNAGRAPEALPFCQRAVEIAPSVPQVQHSYAAALAAAGRCDDAERRLAEARRLDPASASYRKPLACRRGG